MSQRIVIDPVTRLEGHAKITIDLDDAGQVSDVRFHVVEFRAFEQFCVGRPFWEMPGITARICGICPVSHILASSKAGDALLSVKIPPAAEKLRRMMNLGQFVQSHALSFFHLSSPDFLLGFDSDPATRNVFGLMAADPELARAGIRLRQFGQEVIELLGGKKIHPAWSAPGGVREALTDEGRDRLRERLPEAKQTIGIALGLFKQLLGKYEKEASVFGNFPTLYMGLVGPDGEWENYDGTLRFIDSDGNVIADHINPAEYKEHIGEAVESYSYMKFPYYRPFGYPSGCYRVGPLARLNVCSRMGTPMADEELGQFRAHSYGNGVVNSAFFYHYARLIEIVAGLERIEMLLDDPEVMGKRLRADAGVNQLHGVGVTEAPRGTLIHDYTVDETGLLQHVNLIVSTGQNNIAINRTVGQIARGFVENEKIPEGVLNRIEAGVRAYDPCLSCATHAAGQMPLHVILRRPDGTVVDEVKRD